MTRGGEKLLTTTLAATCGVLFVLALALQFGVGRGYHWLEPESVSADNAASGAIDREPFQLPPQSEFVAINQKPLFNDDRRPTKEEPADTSEGPPPSPLNISLTGTLLVGNPSMHMAMVRENGKVNTIALKEGMPLPGDQGAWTLTQVKNRSAVFKSSTGDEVEVELATVQPGQKAGPQGRNPAAPVPARAATPVPPGTPATAQSEELQRRIEERRKQMREAAERMKAERQEQPPQPQQQPQQQ